MIVRPEFLFFDHRVVEDRIEQAEDDEHCPYPGTQGLLALCHFGSPGPTDAWSGADGKGGNAPADASSHRHAQGVKRGSKGANPGLNPTKNSKKVEKSAQFRLAHLNISALKPPWR